MKNLLLIQFLSSVDMKTLLKSLRNNSVVGPIIADFTAPVPLKLMRAFEIYFAFHIFIMVLLYYLARPSEKYTIASLAILLVASVLTLFRRYCRLGLLVILFYQTWWFIIGTFPLTGNHQFLEGYILLFLIVFPSRIVDHSKRLVDGTSCHLIQFAILYAYFFSAFHKILHGFWLNGELLGWSMFSFNHGSGIYVTGKFILSIVANLFHSPISNIPFDDRSLEMGLSAVSIPTWLVITLIIIHWFAILVELAVPILVVIYRNQKLGRYLLLAMIMMIGLPSLEVGFMFAVLGCCFLFFPKRPQRNYTILLLLHALLPVSVIGLLLTGNLP